MSNTITTTDQTAAEKLEANIATAQALEAERIRLATAYRQAQERITAGDHTAEDLDAYATNGTKAEALAASVQALEAQRPRLEQAIRQEEAEQWANSLRDEMPEGTGVRAEAIRTRAAAAIADVVAEAREELEEVARFGSAAEAHGYRLSRAGTTPVGMLRMTSRDSGVLLDGVSYNRVDASNVGEELGKRVDREHAQVRAMAARDAR